jgi:hypothetical protein
MLLPLHAAFLLTANRWSDGMLPSVKSIQGEPYGSPFFVPSEGETLRDHPPSLGEKRKVFFRREGNLALSPFTRDKGVDEKAGLVP